MYKLFVLGLASACTAAHAQTPATNPMPDGSRDMYIGLGVQSAPRYDGAEDRRVQALPMLQAQWSNGLFVSGMTGGMHLSSSPSVEYGPMVFLAPGRDASGARLMHLGTVGDSSGDPGGPSTWLPPPVDIFPIDDAQPAREEPPPGTNRLEGLRTLKRRVLYGGFFNVYLAPQVRLTTTALYGAGNDRRGLRMHVALQHLAQDIAPHHSLAVQAGVTFVNRAHNRAYFGVSRAEAETSVNPPYAPGGGLADVRVGARWNWALSPAWMVSSGVQASRLLGDAKDSPLVERPVNLSVATGLAYRF